MKTLFARLRQGVVWLVLGFMLVTVVRTALAESPTAPRPEDVEKSKRVLGAPGADLRMVRPEGQWVGGLGIIEPASPERRLAPSAMGRIVAIPVPEGTFVEAGAVLVQLESDLEQAVLAASEAEVVSSELALRRIRGTVRSEDLSALRKEAAAARVRAAQSSSTFDRISATSSSGGVSREEVEKAQRQAEQDGLAADAAESRRRSAEEGRPLDVRVAQANLDAARARRDQALAQLMMKQITAPIAGEVLEVLFDVGEFVQPGGAEPVVVMGDTRTLRARVDVDERDVDQVFVGGRAMLTVDALPGQQFEGRIVSVARRMGRKNVRSNEPTERIDTKILEVVVELGAVDLIVGQRVMAYLQKKG